MTEDLPPRSMHLPPDWDALARYHAGESPAGEARHVARWLVANPRDAALLAALDEAVDHAVGVEAAGRALPETVDVEAALRAVKARRGDAGRAAARARRTRAWWVAGGLAAAAGLALLMRPARDANVGGDPAPLVVAGGRALEPGATFATAVGQRDSVRLPDGTRVTLAPGSRLEVADGYGRAAREVAVTGQALFTVVHDEARPFTVRAGAAQVRDIGTVFAVRTDGAAGGAGNSVTVAVTEGRVALARAQGAGVELDAGDRGTLGVSGAPVAERGVVTPQDVAWATTGTLAWRAAPLAMVAGDLERWYGVTLRVDDRRLASRRLTATFTNEPIDQVVQVIALALGAAATRDGGVVTLRPTTGAPGR